MKQLMQAEWQKILGNRWVIGLLVWVFPIGAFALSVIFIALTIFSPGFQENVIRNTSFNWTSELKVAWGFLSNPLGRMFLIGLTAVVFAGEYQWGTWKNILPRNQRYKIILAKFIMLAIVIIIAITATSLIWGGGRIITAQLGSVTVTPEVSQDTLVEFFKDYLFEAGLALTAILITAIIVAFAAMVSRSILGAVLVGLGISIVEPLILGLLYTISVWSDSPAVLHIGRFLPIYNNANIQSWVRLDQPVQLLTNPFNGLSIPTDSLSFSIFVLFLWLSLGTGLVLYAFQRQDIVN